MKNVFFIVTIFLVMFSVKAQDNRAMYIDSLDERLGDATKENELLIYAKANSITTLLLYRLHRVNKQQDLSSVLTNTALANFIYRGKTQYGILHVGASGENETFFKIIDAYNNSRSKPLEKIDIYNLEFEYWQKPDSKSGKYYCASYLTPKGLKCTRENLFNKYVSVLQNIKILAVNNSHPITTEAYVGWTTPGEAKIIGKNLDKVRVHAYVANPNGAFSRAKKRLIGFANGNPNLAVSIIFSAEHEANKMGVWLDRHSMLAAEKIFTEYWKQTSASWTNNIKLTGFTYFTYSEQKKVTLSPKKTERKRKQNKYRR